MVSLCNVLMNSLEKPSKGMPNSTPKLMIPPLQITDEYLIQTLQCSCQLKNLFFFNLNKGYHTFRFIINRSYKSFDRKNVTLVAQAKNSSFLVSIQGYTAKIVNLCFPIQINIFKYSQHLDGP